MEKDLQVENGNFTRIVNPLIEELIKIPFKGCELAVALFIIRKTYGYQKKQDEISLTQFQKGLNRSRQTIVSALKNLQLVKVARLVKTGVSKKHSNLWEINKYSTSWELVNMARLVQRKRGTSLTEAPQLVKTARHTKEITKEKTKEYIATPCVADKVNVNNFLKVFNEFNPGMNWGNKTERSSAEWLIEKYGEENAINTAKYALSIQAEKYAPKITTPYLLKTKLGDLLAYYKKQSNNQIQSL